MDKNRTASAETKRQFIFMAALIGVVMLVLIGYSGAAIYTNMSDALISVGENSLAREKEQVAAYMQKTIGILETSAVGVDSMIMRGAEAGDIYRFLKLETDRFAADFDENYTGIYGYIRGEYIDGTDWQPDEDYAPWERVWYKSAVSEEGGTCLTEPYVDAQTGMVIVSISKTLMDGESVIAMDMTLQGLQNITESINMNNTGYGFITNDEGLIIAHSSIERVGGMLADSEDTEKLSERITSGKRGNFSAVLDGENVIVFYENIIDDWCAVMVIAKKEMYSETVGIMVRNTILCAVLFLVIIIFVYDGFRKIMASVKNAEKNRKRVDKMNLEMVRALTQAIDAKDEYTNGHSKRVGDYSKEIAARMGKSEKETANIYYAALLHDVGKIRIPDGIINKKGRLTDEEFNFMKLHSLAGHRILRHIGENPLIAVGAKEHHERYDGSGYPYGLEGKDISEIGRIVAVADAYDAMTSNRSYRGVMAQEKVREQIEKGRGTQFDPQIADIMLDMIDNDKEYTMREFIRSEYGVLMVDDDERQHEMFRSIIKDKPEYSVRNALSGKEALEMIKTFDPQVILLDMVMPDMDGFETYEKLKPYTKAKAVFLTDEITKENMEKVSALGAADIFMKPFEPVAILEVLRSLFDDDAGGMIAAPEK